MSTITATEPMESPCPWPLYRMPVEQYEAMVESGFFTKHDRLHLINGILVAKMTQGDDHCVTDDLCRVALSAVLPPGWFVRPSKPVRLPPDGDPEPDEAVVRGSIRDYGRGNAECRARTTSHWSWRSRTQACEPIERWPPCTEELASRSTGS